jgi:hypothetical protein
MNILANKKSHNEYPVTNTQWKVIDYSLNGYLEGLNLKGYKDGNGWGIFEGITQSYLRFRYKSDKNVVNDDALVRIDPWHRVFKCFPPDKLKLHSAYEYYCFRNDDIKVDVNVIVTTVNEQKVYCVDIVQ